MAEGGSRRRRDDVGRTHVLRHVCELGRTREVRPDPPWATGVRVLPVATKAEKRARQVGKSARTPKVQLREVLVGNARNSGSRLPGGILTRVGSIVEAAMLKARGDVSVVLPGPPLA